MTDIDLSTGTAPSPERTRQLAETFAELARVLCHQTRHHEALRYPADADRLVRELSAMAGRLPQLLAQAGAWLEAEHAAGRVRAADGDYAGRPDAAVSAARVRLDMARGAAAALRQELDFAASLTCDLGGVEDGSEGGERDA